MIKKRAVLLSFVAAVLTLLPVSSFAASVFLNQTAKGTYVVQGTGLAGVSGFEVTVNYNAAELGSSPSVVSGSLLQGGMVQANTGLAGQIRIVAIKSVAINTNSGAILVINFSGSGTASSASLGPVKAINGTGGAVALAAGGTISTMVPVADGSQGDTTTPTSPTGGTTTTTLTGGATSGGSSTGVVGGSVTLPTEEPVARDRKEYNQPEQVAAVPTAPRESEPSASIESESREQDSSSKALDAPAAPVPSVLERFRVFQGERTVKNLAALFDRHDIATFTQDPPVFIADGKGTVKVTVSKVHGGKAPNFAFSSAQYVSLKKVGDGEWLVEVRPNKNAVGASISMLVDGVAQDLPLAVAPKARVDLAKPGKVSEADFELYLQERGTATAPKHDLNNDGKRDYLDDYIFTANFLVEREKQGAKGKEKVPSAKTRAGK